MVEGLDPPLGPGRPHEPVVRPARSEHVDERSPVDREHDPFTGRSSQDHERQSGHDGDGERELMQASAESWLPRNDRGLGADRGLCGDGTGPLFLGF